MADSDHFTAVIQIRQVTFLPSAPTMRSSENDKKRETRDVAQITIRADSIKSLIAKATAHLSLVEDIPHG